MSTGSDSSSRERFHRRRGRLALRSALVASFAPARLLQGRTLEAMRLLPRL
jgi:hypothetical protein